MADKNEFRSILRIGDRDVKGETPIGHALTRTKGVSFMFANAITKVLKLNINKQAGEFSQKEIEQMEDVMKNPVKYKLPEWIYNSRKDVEDGQDKHMISSDLDLKQRFDIRRLRKLRTYRGFRHSRGDKGLKVKARGQRTKSRGRKGKTIGVVRKKK